MQTLGLAVSELCGGRADRWQSLLDCHGGLLRLADGRADYAAREAGLSPEQARRFAALVELVREGTAERLQPGARFNGSADVHAHFRPLATDRVETFNAVLLDNKHCVLRTVEISRGTLTASLVHPREVVWRVSFEDGGVDNDPTTGPFTSPEHKVSLGDCGRPVAWKCSRVSPPSASGALTTY